MGGGLNNYFPETQSLKEFQPDNYLDDYAKAQQSSQSAQAFPQEQQLRQQAVATGQMSIDQQNAVNAAWKAAAQPDANGHVQFDPDKLTNALAISGHGSAVPGIVAGLVQMQKEKGDVAKQKADLATSEADTAGAGANAVILSGLDPNVKNAFYQHMTDAGYGDIAQGLQQHIAQNPGQEMQFWQAVKNASAKQQELGSQKTTADARMLGATVEQQRLQGQLDPKSPLYNPSAASLAMGTAPGADQIQAGEVSKAGQIAGAQEAAKQPYQIQLENIRKQVSLQSGSNKDATDKIEALALKPYEDKMSQISELNNALTQAQAGNVTAARGVLLKLIGVTNPDGTKRYNAAEADRLLQQGGVSQRLQGSLSNALTGNNWTPKMLDDMTTFAASQGEAAKTNLNRGIDNVNKLYGTNVGNGLRQPTSNSQQDAIPANVIQALSGVGKGVHTLSDGSKWMKAADGTVTKQ